MVVVVVPPASHGSCPLRSDLFHSQFSSQRLHFSFQGSHLPLRLKVLPRTVTRRPTSSCFTRSLSLWEFQGTIAGVLVNWASPWQFCLALRLHLHCIRLVLAGFRNRWLRRLFCVACVALFADVWARCCGALLRVIALRVCALHAALEAGTQRRVGALSVLRCARVLCAHAQAP